VVDREPDDELRERITREQVSAIRSTDVASMLSVAVGAVDAGLHVFGPGLIDRDTAGTGSVGDSLTPAEEAVYAELQVGYTNHEIAERLGVSINTVKYHLSAIFAKLGVSNRTQAAASRRRFV
jgi:DNA-binding NarL/FixJ family response regulator